MASEWEGFSTLFAEPQKNGLTRAKGVRGAGMPMVNMGELFAFPRILPMKMDRVLIGDKERSFILQDGDLLFARQSLVFEGAGKCSIFLGGRESTVFESHIIRCRLNRRRADPLYYFYFFQSPQGRDGISSIVEQGAGAAGIRGSDLARLLVPVPTLPVQQAASSVLNALDSRIEVLKESNHSLEAIARAIFKSWFVDFDPVRAKAEGREPEGMDAATVALFSDHLVDSEIGAIPSGWSNEPLESCLDFKEGPGIRNWQYTDAEDGVRFINIRCIKSGDLDVETASRVSKVEGNAKYAHFHLAAWDLVVSTSGTLGRCAVVRPKHLPLLLNTSVIRFRPIHPLTFSYAHGYLHGTVFLDELNAQATGSVQKNFGPMHLKRMKMLKPAGSILEAHERIARPLFERILHNRSLIDNLSELRDTLLPRLISGKLRVPEAEKLVEAVL